jgi:four helix bundle protein
VPPLRPAEVRQVQQLLTQLSEALDRLPRLPGSWNLYDQIWRAGVSVLANLVEGHGRGTQRQFTQFLRIARGSLHEVRALVDLQHTLHRRWLPPALERQLRRSLANVSRLLHKLLDRSQASRSGQASQCG